MHTLVTVLVVIAATLSVSVLVSALVVALMVLSPGRPERNTRAWATRRYPDSVWAPDDPIPYVPVNTKDEFDAIVQRSFGGQR